MTQPTGKQNLLLGYFAETSLATIQATHSNSDTNNTNSSPKDRGQEGAVGSYTLQAVQSGAQIPVGCNRSFLVHCRPDRPWDRPVSCTMGTWSLYPDGKRPVRSVGHSPVQRFRMRSAIRSCTALCLLWHVMGWPTFAFTSLRKGSKKKYEFETSFACYEKYRCI